MRQHDALGLARRAGGVDDGGELAGEDLRGAQAVGGDVGAASGGNQCFVAETFAGRSAPPSARTICSQLRELRAKRQKLLHLRSASGEHDLCAAMFQDVGHAVGRFVEVDGNGDAARAGDGKIGGVPFGAVGCKKADAVAGLHAEFDEGGGESGDAAEEIRRRRSASSHRRRGTFARGGSAVSRRR